MAYRSTSTSTTAATATITATLPAGAAASDILIAFVGGTWIAARRPVIPPAGWTQIQINNSGASGYGAAYWAPGNVSDFNFSTTGGGNVAWNVHIHAFTGRNTSAPITASDTALNSSGFAAAPAPSVPAVSGDDLAVCWIDGQTNVVFGAAPGGYTDRADTSPDIGSRMTSSTKEAVSAGATGTISRTTSNGYTNRVMFTVAIAASSGPTASIGNVAVDRTDGTATVPVTLSGPAPVGGVTVNYATQDDTATAPAYYTAASGTLTFAEGETTKNVTVSIAA